MDSHDGQQYRLSTDNDSKVNLSDTGARPKENMSQRASYIQDQSFDLDNEDAHHKSDREKLVPRQISQEAGLHDELLRERARLQKLVDERRQMAETRRLQKEIEYLRRQLDEVDLADIGQPAESKSSPGGPENIQDCRASESLVRKVDVNMPNVMTESLAGVSSRQQSVSSAIESTTAPLQGIESDEVPGRRLESFSEEKDSEVSGGRERQPFHAVGTPNWFRGTLPDISSYNRRSMGDVSQYLTILKNEGIKYMQSALQKDLDDWRHMELNVALVGEAGSGKSSLINAILGLTADDEGAAEVGSIETTLEARSYVHPENEHVIFYDLPGIGTPNFPKDEYLRKIGWDMYDFFLIVSQRRFRDNDKWFATMIQERNLQLYFVRTCIDHDIEDDKKAHPQTHNQQQLIAKIREDIKNNLLRAGLNEKKILIALVNSHNKLEHDFSNLMKELIENAPDIKREAVIFALFARSDEIIQTKVLALRQRIKRTALIASVGSLVPIPGVGEAVEIMAIYKETQFYRRQLQIDDKSLEELAKSINLKLDTLRNNADIKSNIFFASTKSLLKFLAMVCASEAVESVIKISIPVVGSMISALISYPVCVASLEKVLALCETEAYALNREVKYWLNKETQV